MSASAPPRIFAPNRRDAATRKARVFSANDQAATFLADDMADDIIERVGFMRIEAKSALIVGMGADQVSATLRSNGTKVSLPDSVAFDDEQPWHGTVDFIANLGRLDRVNDLPGALIHMRSALAPGGIAMASFVAAGSLQHMRSALITADGDTPAARMHPMVDNRAATGLLERAGFARQVVDSRTLNARYSSLGRLVMDLREQGLANQLSSAPPALTRSAWERAKEAFSEAADPDGKVTERFEILTLTGWRD